MQEIEGAGTPSVPPTGPVVELRRLAALIRDAPDSPPPEELRWPGASGVAAPPGSTGAAAAGPTAPVPTAPVPTAPVPTAVTARTGAGVGRTGLDDRLPELAPGVAGALLADAARVALPSLLDGHRRLLVAVADAADSSAPDVEALTRAAELLTGSTVVPTSTSTSVPSASGAPSRPAAPDLSAPVFVPPGPGSPEPLSTALSAGWSGWLAGLVDGAIDALAGDPTKLTAAATRWQQTALDLDRLAETPADDPRGRALNRLLGVHAGVLRVVAQILVELGEQVESTRHRVRSWLPGPGIAAQTLTPAFLADRLEALAELLEGLVVRASVLLGALDGSGVAAVRVVLVLAGAPDPGRPGDTAVDSPTARAAGSEPIRFDHDVALLQEHFSARARGDDPAPPPGAWRQLDAASSGVPDRLLDHPATGFAAAFFARGPDEPVVVCFAGTDFGGELVRDFLVEDLRGGLVVSPQVVDVLALVEATDAAGLRDRVVWSGHSLGGRLAAVAALVTGDTAVTFNAAGVSTATVGYLSARARRSPVEALAAADRTVRAYRTAGDVLTELQERLPTSPLMPDAVGHGEPLGRSEPNLIRAHLMPHVVREWERAHGALLDEAARLPPGGASR